MCSIKVPVLKTSFSTRTNSQGVHVLTVKVVRHKLLVRFATWSVVNTLMKPLAIDLTVPMEADCRPP